MKYGLTAVVGAALGFIFYNISSFPVAKRPLLNWRFDLRHMPDLREDLDKRCEVSRMFRFSFFFSTGDVFAQRKFFFGCHGTSSFSLHNCHLFWINVLNLASQGDRICLIYFICALFHWPCWIARICDPFVSLGWLIHILKMSLLLWGGCFTPSVAITLMYIAAGRKEQVWLQHIRLPYLKSPP